MANVHVIDSIMGSGKTTWAINYINQNKDRRFIYCTPFMEEVNRILTACDYFKQPTEDNPGKTKQADFIQLLKEGECIATTHELFKRVGVTNAVLSLIKEYEYILILDEVIDVVVKVPATKDDIRDIRERTRIDEGTKQIIWTDKEYSGNHKHLKQLIDTKTVIQYEDNLLLWLFPIS